MDEHKYKKAEGLAWQISVWDRMVPVYVREIDKRFQPIIERVVKLGDLKPGQHALDLGTGTGSVAIKAAEAVAPNGHITAVDISPEMLALRGSAWHPVELILRLLRGAERRYLQTAVVSTQFLRRLV